ncbi:MAG: hypothetical protein QOE61_3601, partial [Micromonosporaceae bacterium]|nr:hypothetical protein [Micromonosporaceae bacterium]
FKAAYFVFMAGFAGIRVLLVDRPKTEVKYLSGDGVGPEWSLRRAQPPAWIESGPSMSPPITFSIQPSHRQLCHWLASNDGDGPSLAVRRLHGLARIEDEW